VSSPDERAIERRRRPMKEEIVREVGELAQQVDELGGHL
jgi:hypothetical protein